MTNRKSALLDSGWQDVQRKTFTKWYNPQRPALELTRGRINSQLDKGEKPTIKDLKTDLCDGVRLLYLLVWALRGVCADGGGVGDYE
jgi:hypothetical protein